MLQLKFKPIDNWTFTDHILHAAVYAMTFLAGIEVGRTLHHG